jgi:predicted CopG family antitoxin
MLDDMKRKANEIGESDRRSSHQTGFAVIALQSQLSQVLSSLQSMQEQFSDVVRELNVVKRKSSIHQLMMMNVLDFLNKNMNPDSESTFLTVSNF